MGLFIRLVSGIEPVFSFMGELWGCMPLAVRLVFTIFFGLAIAIQMLRASVL